MHFSLPDFKNDQYCYGLTVCSTLEKSLDDVLARFNSTATEKGEMTALYRTAQGTAFLQLYLANYHAHIDIGLRSALKNPPKRTHKRIEVEQFLETLLKKSAKISIVARCKASLKQMRRRKRAGIIKTLLRPAEKGDLTFYPSSLRTLVKNQRFSDLEWRFAGDDIFFILHLVPLNTLIKRNYLRDAYYLSKALFEFLVLGQSERLAALSKETENA